MERLRRAEVLAERYGVSVPEVAMRYIFGSPMNVFAVVSTTNADRMGMNLRASTHPLSPEDRRFLEA
jgi:aryl-alcohol dehydrogenase-like predicted oxidoreductase